MIARPKVRAGKQSISKNLIRETQQLAKVHTGREAAALALAANTKLSAGAASRLMNLPLSHSKIGLTDKTFREFRNSLELLVPEASNAIAKIPEEQGLSAAEIADYVGKLQR